MDSHRKRSGGETPPRKNCVTHMTLTEFFDGTSEHVGLENPTNTEICLPTMSKDHSVPQHTVDKIVTHLCFEKFYSFCVFAGINRGITLFLEFVNSLYYTNFRMYTAIMRCSTEDWDEFIQAMVWKFIALRMVEIGFLFGKDGQLVDTPSKGVLFDKYCLPKNTPEKSVSVSTPIWLSFPWTLFSPDDDLYYPDDDWDSSDEDMYYLDDKVSYSGKRIKRIPKNHWEPTLMELYREEMSDQESSVTDCDDYTQDPDYIEMPPVELWSHYDHEGKLVAPPLDNT